MNTATMTADTEFEMERANAYRRAYHDLLSMASFNLPHDKRRAEIAKIETKLAAELKANVEKFSD